MAYKLTGRLLFYTLMIITVLYTALVFATFKSARDRAFSRVSALYAAAFKAPEKTTVTRVEVHERKVVPPPLPATAPPNLIRAPQAVFKPGRSKPVPIRPPKEMEEVITESTGETSAPPAPAGKRPETAPAREAAPVVAKGKEQETAFSNLLAGNKSMADLVNQGDPKLKFKGWSVIKSEGDEHLLDLAFQNTADNSDIHYVWSVNNASKKVVPINHYAKRLAAK